MKYCPYCGKQIDEQDFFCRYCGKKLPKEQETTTANLTDNAKSEQATTIVKVVNEDKPKKKQEIADVSIWWGILGFFIPIVGLIVFIDCYHSNPARAKVCGIPALFSFILNIVLIFAYWQYWYF